VVIRKKNCLFLYWESTPSSSVVWSVHQQTQRAIV
jgi:hypothetical protein